MKNVKFLLSAALVFLPFMTPEKEKDYYPGEVNPKGNKDSSCIKLDPKSVNRTF